ncbi:MAG: 30S ribosomal protein S8 [Abditibacteriota bacterium]|nr:30S ribosomal protein S8 [Abditibacteriota bacterium]MBR4750067.1 30S ribosomal protein S8 [Abditibacteriota bacterium]
MMVTDPVADLLTRIRNANQASHESALVPASKLNMELVKILADEGFIKGYDMVADAKFPTAKVYLKYGPKQEKIITNLKRISKPGLRVYVKRDAVPRVLRGLGIAIISTSKGVMVDREARKLGIGGEVLCYVW